MLPEVDSARRYVNISQSTIVVQCLSDHAWRVARAQRVPKSVRTRLEIALAPPRHDSAYGQRHREYRSAEFDKVLTLHVYVEEGVLASGVDHPHLTRGKDSVPIFSDHARRRGNDT